MHVINLQTSRVMMISKDFHLVKKMNQELYANQLRHAHQIQGGK